MPPSHLAARSEIGRIVMAVSPADRAAFECEFAALVEQLDIQLVTGGAARTDSVKAGLDAISGDSAIQLVANSRRRHVHCLATRT